MNLADLVQKHVKDIDTAARAASRQTRTDADLQAPANLFTARINRVDARIALLETQRAESDKRFVTAIEEQKKLRAAMEDEAKVWSERTQVKDGSRQIRRTIRRDVREADTAAPAAAPTAEDEPARKAAKKPAAKLAIKPRARSRKKPDDSK